MALSAAGIGSGLDVNGIVNQLLSVERQPLLSLDKKEAGLQAKLSAYGSLKGALSSFQTAVRGLSDLSKFQIVKATSADATVYTASASGSAVPGTYAIEVTELAQAHKLRSGGFANTTDAVGYGTLTIQYGTYDSGGNTFTLNAAKAAQTVTLSSTQNTLAGIRDAINAANIDVTATIVNDGGATPNKLVITSKDTGAANSLKITVSDNDGIHTDTSGLSQLAYDPTAVAGSGKNLTQTLAAQNATLTVDGITSISKSSNTITDVVQGVTLNLVKKSAAGVSAALSVVRDTATVKTSVEAFVKAYNDINKSVKDLTAYNATTKQASVLQGDSSALSIQRQIRAALNNTVTFVSGSYTLLSQIGVAFQKDGTLTVDSVKLDSAISTNFNDIAALFTALGKATDGQVGYISATANTKPGSYAVSVSQLAVQGYNEGAATAALADGAPGGGTFSAPFVVDANNDTFSLKVDGVQAATITLTQGSYATAAALTAEIQSRINGDSALKAAGVVTTLSFDSPTDKLKITSNRYGSASTVEFTAVDTNTATTLGFTVGAGVTGVDVAGTINGATAAGSGQFLTGATGDNSEGLKLQISGGAIGARGTVNYSQGYAYQLDKLADNLLGANGPITSRTDGLNKSVKDIGNQRDSLNRRLVDVERNLRDQFTRLDGIVSRLKSTNDFLTQQLSRLP